jgi:hypothetical protein
VNYTLFLARIFENIVEAVEKKNIVPFSLKVYPSAVFPSRPSPSGCFPTKIHVIDSDATCLS